MRDVYGDVYRGCVRGMCIRNVYEGCYYYYYVLRGMCMRDGYEGCV